MTAARRALVALDIDGTVLHEDGTLSDAVREQILRVRDAGVEVTLATGRSVSMTLPVVARLGIQPEYVVCSNGAITMRRDETAEDGYARWHVETFDPTQVLTTIHENLEGASYAVEDEHGAYRFEGRFPEGALGTTSEQVSFEELLRTGATRVVVISPEHDTEEFLQVVERMGLHQVSYNIGWTAWLDIAPDGVNKGTALERVAEELGADRDAVVVMGDGRNDIDMFGWAVRGGGTAVAMGQAPPEVVEASSEQTSTDLEDGVAAALRRLFPG
ncbi:HAD family hydrolase [Homoserinibacter sp. YIM 151385]|uniref:HAD family hydrolase n=1 Tax=Homoserinibacter sp. YIM 151385 TaxID=2985506 RepID=UPI0022F0186B|nr:HAD family hydrolase [Homoserinibacter sp. YIM 151385]WBU37111.1 HAD family hydrolase [Homoserinibacter sp. YIM 151385]